MKPWSAATSAVHDNLPSLTLLYSQGREISNKSDGESVSGAPLRSASDHVQISFHNVRVVWHVPVNVGIYACASWGNMVKIPKVLGANPQPASGSITRNNDRRTGDSEMRAGIIGAGAVGSARLTALVARGCARKIVVVNRERNRAEGLVKFNPS
jgi:Shikimate / quinate 5-dehydrogenase